MGRGSFIIVFEDVLHWGIVPRHVLNRRLWQPKPNLVSVKSGKDHITSSPGLSRARQAQ